VERLHRAPNMTLNHGALLKLVADAADALTTLQERAEKEKAEAARLTDKERILRILLDANDYFGSLVSHARRSAEKASVKFPQPNYVTLKIAEEAGEVVRGAVHYAEGRMEWEEVEGEVVQLLAMLIRFVTEGDRVNGIVPPAALGGRHD